MTPCNKRSKNQPTMANWDALPVDVTWRILARLPTAAILRFRGVCRGWRIMFLDPHFLTLYREHHRRRARMPLFLYRRNFDLDDPVPEERQRIARIELQAVDIAAREAMPILRFHDILPPLTDDEAEEEGVFAMDLGAEIEDPDSVFRIQGSCDGLLLISYSKSLYLCNPTTGHWTGLPSLNQEQVIIGFYACDPPGDQQRVYHILYRSSAPETESQVSYWIRVVGIPEEVEAVYEIGRPLSQGMPEALDRLLMEGLRPGYEAPPVTIRSTLHWLPPNIVGSNMIVLFDTLAEHFQWIRSPINVLHRQGFQLMEVDGLLAMACRNTARTSLEIWVRHHQGKEDWVLRHSISLPEAAILKTLGYDQLRFPPVYIVSDELDVLIPCPYILLHSSADGEEWQRYQRLQHWIIATPHMFEENFDAHGLFLVPQVNHDGQPPFLFTAALKDH